MEGVIKKIKKLGLEVETVSFHFDRSYKGMSIATLGLENSAGSLSSSTSVKKLSVSSVFNTDANEDTCLDALFIMAGFSDGEIEPVSHTKVNSENVVDTTPPPPPPVKEVVQEPIKTMPTNNNAGFSIPTLPSSNSAPVNNGIGNYTKPKPPEVVIEEPTPAPPEKKTGGIRDVQMLAIQAMMKLRKINYEELVKAAFEENKIVVEVLPPIEELTEDQALEVIRYGNNKFKK